MNFFIVVFKCVDSTVLYTKFDDVNLSAVMFCLSGRGTVVSGTLERGIIKKGDEAEFVGHNRSFKSVITGEWKVHRRGNEW